MMRTYTATAWRCYYLVDPRHHRPFYVGITTQNLTIRLTQHLAEARAGKGGKRKLRYLRVLAGQGLEPVIVEMERVEAKEWERCERKHVARLTRLGYRLVNRAKGGRGQRGLKFTPEERKNIGQAVSRAKQKRSE